MDYRPYHTIILASWDEFKIQALHRLAKKCFPRVTPVVISVSNHIATFMIPTDGAKKGGDDDERATQKRDEFWRLLDRRAYDRYRPVSVVEVAFGSTRSPARVVRQFPDKRHQ
jgi:hypothetical protein